jgi:hypothetical protein
VDAQPYRLTPYLADHIRLGADHSNMLRHHGGGVLAMLSQGMRRQPTGKRELATVALEQRPGTTERPADAASARADAVALAREERDAAQPCGNYVLLLTQKNSSQWVYCT